MTLTTLQLSNSTVAYRSRGTGEPLVLIHGVGMQSAAWGPQIDHFAQDYHVIALDMPGHGGSDLLPVGSQLADYVDWCADVIAALNLGPVNLVGHSMGALIAGGIAASRPNLVQRVALLNGVYVRGPDAKTAVQGRAATIREGQIDLQTPLKRWFDGGQQQAHDQVAGWLGNVDLTGYATAYTAFACGDAVYADRFQNIMCPFLAMTGDGDPNSTPAMSQAMATAVQNGRSVTINGHRHMINLTAAGQVNAHLQTWLNQPTTPTT
ncbi:MAG: alpha/beta fold hydrolase [Planktomarina sp.]